MTAKVKNEWLSAKVLSQSMGINRLGTVEKTLKRLFDKGLVARRRVQPAMRRWHYTYQATEAGQLRQELGPLPRVGKRLDKRDLEVLVRSVTEVLDTDRIKYEHRQVIIALDPFISGVLRGQCSKPRKRDRAKQVTYASESFVIVIANTNIAQVILKDPMKWDRSMSQWMQRAGISRTAAQIIIKQIWNQIPGGTTRVEIPILEQMVKRLEVQCHVETLLDGEKVVESNINYSMNEIGLEYFGGTRWVDALVRVLIGFQHSTTVSEAARDQWLEDVFRALEEQRKEREKKEEQDKPPRRDPDYIG